MHSIIISFERKRVLASIQDFVRPGNSSTTCLRIAFGLMPKCDFNFMGSHGTGTAPHEYAASSMTPTMRKSAAAAEDFPTWKYGCSKTTHDPGPSRTSTMPRRRSASPAGRPASMVMACMPDAVRTAKPQFFALPGSMPMKTLTDPSARRRHTRSACCSPGSGAGLPRKQPRLPSTPATGTGRRPGA